MKTSCYVLLAVCILQILTPSIYGSVSYDGSVNISEAYSTCNKGWFEYGDMCYKLGGTEIKGGVVWETATNSCKEEKGLLATVYDQDISDFLSAFLLLHAQSSLFIGLSDRVIEGEYKWADGTPYNYTNFEPGEPGLERREVEDCMEMIYKTINQKGKMGQWNDVSCDYRFPYICQKAKEGLVDKSDPRWMFRNTVNHLDPRYCETEKGLGWLFEESCLYVVPEKKSWTQAEDHCEKEYKGHLLTLDYRVNYFINYIFREVTEEMWIGVKIKAETQQKWSSGWLVTFENWANQEKYVDGTCVSRDASGSWLIQPCEKELWFICEHSTSKAMPPVLKPSAENTHCPKMPQGSHGWRDIGGDFCYFYATEASAPWHEASYNCIKRGGTLASIHSQEEYEILSLFIRYYVRNFYIGLYRPARGANELVWVDGSPVNFTRWQPGEPNNWNQEEQCTEIRQNTMTWNDGACTWRMGYICSTQKIAFAPNSTQILISEGSTTIAFAPNSTQILIAKGSRTNTATIYALLGIIACLVSIVIACGVLLHRSKFSVRNTRLEEEYEIS